MGKEYLEESGNKGSLENCFLWSWERQRSDTFNPCPKTWSSELSVRSETQICQAIFSSHTFRATMNFLILCDEDTPISSQKDALPTNWATLLQIHILLVQAKITTLPPIDKILY